MHAAFCCGYNHADKVLEFISPQAFGIQTTCMKTYVPHNVDFHGNIVMELVIGNAVMHETILMHKNVSHSSSMLSATILGKNKSYDLHISNMVHNESQHATRWRSRSDPLKNAVRLMRTFSTESNAIVSAALPVTIEQLFTP